MCTENYHWHHDYIRLAWDSGFAFNVHRTKTSFDWSNVGILDIDRIIRDRDVALVEKHMGTVLNYCLDEEQTKILEPTFVKLFQLGQLSLQYLQFCKRYLDNTVVLLKKELGHYKEDNSKLKETTEELKNEISNLKKRVKELKQCSQLQTTENAVSPTFMCNICSKLFVSEEFLIAHVKRRHEVDLNPFQTETDKLQLEIKELKERLNSTEKLIQNDNRKDIQTKQQNIPNNDAAIENTAHVGELKDKFEHLRQYIERELTLLRSEKHYQEKYEKWFEMVFQKLDSSKSEFQGYEDKSSMIGDGDKLMHKESSTQTNPEIYVESETMTDEVPNVVSEENIDTKPIIVDFDMEKIQNDIKLNTVNHLDQMQGVLEKKLSGGFEQIQTQMNFFWKKLGDIEMDKKQNAINIAVMDKQGNSDVLQPVLMSDPIPNDNYHHINTLLHNINSNDSSETPITKKTQPVPAPRIVKTYSTTKNSRPKDKNAGSPIKVITGRQPKIRKKYQATSSEDISSEEIVEIVKAPLQVTAAKVVKPVDLKEKIIVRPKCESKCLKSYRSKATEELSNSETEEEEQSIDAQPQLKQSTTSTLGQRSLTSLKQMIKDEDIMKGLNVELHEMVNLRLKEIGISPQWTGIPDKSYKQAIRVVNHQTDLSRKKYSNYNIIRDVILKILNEKVKRQTRNIKTNLERIKQKQEKKSVAKQVLKKRTKQEKQSTYPLRNTFTLDVKSEDKQIKGNNAYTRRAMDKDIVQVSSNIVQEKSNLVGATPVKKKVLFDLEDSSSTSKVAVPIGVIEVAQGDNSNLDNKQELNFERTFIVSNPGKKEQLKPIEELGKMSFQKSQNLVETPDCESTTTLASSISETAKLKVNPAELGIEIQNVTKDDISDWDISDILT